MNKNSRLSPAVSASPGSWRSTAVLSFALALSLAGIGTVRGQSGTIDLREQELSTRLTVGYAVRLIDMNRDGRLDIVIVDSKRLLWLENPNWHEHPLTDDREQKFDNVCFAPADIDGDGQLDFAMGADWQPANTKSGGTIQWIRGAREATSPWNYHAIGTEPTVHRMAFADLDKDGRPELIVAPLKGRDTTEPAFAENGVRILSYAIPKDPVAGPWMPSVLTEELHVVHNFQVIDVDQDGNLDLLIVSFEGVSLLERTGDGKWRRTRIGTGDQQSSPNKGASEIKLGRLRGSRDYVATIEPWHGDKVVVYMRPTGDRPAGGEWLWNRQVLDDQLKWGHAVWCANLDDDEDDELIIGVRDDLNDQARRGLRIYDPVDASQGKWRRQVVDPGSVAIEDLAAADLNGDGRVDIVTVGRQTQNVKIYWNETKRRE